MVTLEALVIALAISAPSDAVLLEFSAQWCGPCRMMEPTVRRLAAEGYSVRKVDIDKDPQAAAQYRVSGVPCFVMLVDGKEVDRVEGSVSHARLVQMFQHRQKPVQPNHRVRAQSPDRPTPTSAGNQRPPATNRLAGNRGQTGANDQDAIKKAFASTVRIQIEDPKGHAFGTGTVVDLHGDEALVATCGHLFRDSNGKGALSVDLFVNGQPKRVPATLISYDLDRDIGFISMRPGMSLTPVPVAPAGFRIQKGEPVFSIGCDKGAAPSVRESKITAIDKYLGPPNIEVAGQPVDGRSGGGLFSADGYLIGICNAADPADDEGIYASLPTIHWELDRIGQSRLYKQAVLASAPSAPAALAPVGSESPRMPTEMPGAPVGALGAVAQQVSTAGQRPLAAATSDDTEVICIVRSRTNPTGGEKVLVLDRPSPELLDRLTRESRRPATSRFPRGGPQRPLRTAAAAPDGQVIRAQSGDR